MWQHNIAKKIYAPLAFPKLPPTVEEIFEANNGGKEMIGHDAPIVQRVYDFYRVLYGHVEKMPKKDKYTLGQKTQNTTLELLELLIGASTTAREKKLALLEQAAIKLDLLKIFIRLANEVKAISPKAYIELEAVLNEIGKMLGGWIRSTKAPF